MGDRVILHSDINCCYASIEHLHHPELAGKPLAVGGDPEARHGIVLTADYIAKKYGVKTGMALWQAKQVCPDITFVSPRMDLYLRFSRMAHEIYAEYTDRQEPYGIDECWLDVTGSSSLKGDGLLIAQEISRRMKSELGITVSVGVSFNKIFAKLGSDYKKPDAITTMYKSEFKQKAWSLPVADLLYVGKSTNRKLALFGIKTIGDLARTDEDVLNSHLGKMGSILWSFANGYDDSPVKLENTHAPIKSVGNSTTTPKDLLCDEDVKIVLYILAESVAARLRENGFRCRVVEISVRDNELFSFTRQKKIDHATNITGEIAAYAYQIFKENYNWSKPIRSVGVRGADLVTDNYWEQIDLLSSVEKWKDTGGKFFLPHVVIAKVFRGKYLCELKSLWNDSKLEFHGTAEKYQNHYCFKELLNECYKKDWVAYCKETFNGAQSVINYLGKYTHRIAISNHRIKSMTEATVTYAVKDYKNKGQWKEKTVPGEEFIRRFLMHVPPKRFVRIRHYGLLSCRNKSKKMTHCRNLLGCKKYISALKNRSAAEMIKLLYNIDVCRCSSCGGKMVPHLPDKHTPSVLVHMRC